MIIFQEKKQKKKYGGTTVGGIACRWGRFYVGRLADDDGVFVCDKCDVLHGAHVHADEPLVFVRLTCILDKVLLELVPVPVLWDVAHEEPVVVVRNGHAHLPAFADLTAVELLRATPAITHTHRHTNST